jgi:hydrogenase-4 component F
VAFTAILRVRSVVGAAGIGSVADRTLLLLGLVSMVVAAVFLLATRNYKRMLGYSSVEHMGILSIGAALGGAGIWAALFHVWSNSLTKGALFLSAGNIRRAAGSASIDEVRGALQLTPRSAALFVAGMFAVTATPPFGPFFSELSVVRAAFASGHGAAAAVFLGCLLLAFLRISRVVFAVVDGRPRHPARKGPGRFGDGPGTVLPVLVFLALSLWIGLFTPRILQDAWSAAVRQLVPVA